MSWSGPKQRSTVMSWGRWSTSLTIRDDRPRCLMILRWFFPSNIFVYIYIYILWCLALPCLALPCLALPCLALPCLALPSLLFSSLLFSSLLFSSLLFSSLLFSYPFLSWLILCTEFYMLWAMRIPGPSCSWKRMFTAGPWWRGTSPRIILMPPGLVVSQTISEG